VQWKVGEVGESHATSLAVDLAVRSIAANHLRNFDVEQMRRMQCLCRLEQSLSTALAAGVRSNASSTAEASITIIGDRVRRELPVPVRPKD